MRRLNMPVSDEANELLTSDPFALLIGMVLDQQVPLEKAFSSPLELKRRMGGELTVRSVSEYNPESFATLFATPPALHRFPKANAERVQKVAQIIMDDYDGDAAGVWTSASTGEQLLQQVTALPGFGKQKAQIFVALLAKQMEVRPVGWRQASAPFGEPQSALSVADIEDKDSLERVRTYKQEKKAAAKAHAAHPTD